MATAASELQVIQVPIDDLRPDPANPRRISDGELDALSRPLRDFGFVQPVLARRDDKLVMMTKFGDMRVIRDARLKSITGPESGRALYG